MRGIIGFESILVPEYDSKSNWLCLLLALLVMLALLKSSFTGNLRHFGLDDYHTSPISVLGYQVEHVSGKILHHNFGLSLWQNPHSPHHAAASRLHGFTHVPMRTRLTTPQPPVKV